MSCVARRKIFLPFRTNARTMVNHSVKDELTTGVKSCAPSMDLDLILLVAWPAILEPGLTTYPLNRTIADFLLGYEND